MKRIFIILLVVGLTACSIDRVEHKCIENDKVDNENSDGVTEFILIEDVHGNIYELHPTITTSLISVKCK